MVKDKLRSAVAATSVALALLLTATTLRAVEIIGHRGASYDAPENTVAAFRLAFAQGADAAELDVYLTQDGQAVVMHDADTRRTTGVSGLVKERTLAELRALDAGTWKGERWRGEKLPTLAEAIACIPDGRRLFIEIKGGPELLPELERVVQTSGKAAAQLPLIGFSYETMRAAKAALPAHEVYWIVASKPEKGASQPPPVEELIAKCQAAQLDGLDLHFSFPIDAAFVSQVHAAGLKLYTWTVDDPTTARQLTTARVDGLTTNRPGWLRAQLR